MAVSTSSSSGSPPVVTLESWTGPWGDDDPDANFKAEVALYSHLDPLSTLANLSANTGIPVGALCHYILAKWASAGAEAIVTMGPTAVIRMADAVAEAEEAGSDEQRLAAYGDIAAQLAWLRHPLDNPDVYGE